VLSRGANQQASMRSGAEASRRATAGPRRALRRNRRTNRDGPAFLHKPGRSCVVSPRRRPSRWRLSPRSPGRRPPAFHLIPRSSGTSLFWTRRCSGRVPRAARRDGHSSETRSPVIGRAHRLRHKRSQARFAPRPSAASRREPEAYVARLSPRTCRTLCVSPRGSWAVHEDGAT
jgi:hypothetical protein